jgi:hypothetical protein
MLCLLDQKDNKAVDEIFRVARIEIQSVTLSSDALFLNNRRELGVLLTSSTRLIDLVHQIDSKGQWILEFNCSLSWPLSDTGYQFQGLWEMAQAV